MIISELQGGENDPDQLLDQELTATAFRAHPYRHPTIGWLADLRVDDAATTCTATTAASTSRTTPRWSSSATWIPPTRSRGARPALRHASRRATLADAATRSSRSSSANVASTIHKEGTTAYLKIALPRAGGDRRRLLSAAGARRRAHRRQGLNLWASFRTPPPQRSARLYRALVNTGLASIGERRPRADAASVPLHDLAHRNRGHGARRAARRRSLARARSRPYATA